MEDQEIPEINVNDVKMELKKKSSSSSISSTSSSYQNLSISPESSGTNLVSMNSTSSKNKSLFKISFSKSQKVDFVHQWNRAAHLIQTNYEEALFQYIQQLKSSFSSFISKRNSTVPDCMFCVLFSQLQMLNLIHSSRPRSHCLNFTVRLVSIFVVLIH